MFEELPEILIEYKDKVGTFNHLPFTGNPKHLLVNVTGAEGDAKDEVKKEPAPQ